MTWEAAYIFRVQQNPSHYPSSQYWDFVIDATNYSTDTDQENALRLKIIDSALYLQPGYAVDLLAKSEAGATVLSSPYGETYYLTVIPGLQTMCPTLFSVQFENPDYTKRSWSTAVADALQTKYLGTFLYDFMTGYAGLFSMDVSPAMNVLSIIIFAARQRRVGRREGTRHRTPCGPECWS